MDECKLISTPTHPTGSPDEDESGKKMNHKSPGGDIIDCVRFYEQPAFDHPLLKGHKILDPPESPINKYEKGNMSDIIQLWILSGESCPEGTIPIRRTTEQDLLRAESIDTFGRKLHNFRSDSNANNGHEHAIGFVYGKLYGATASINVWSPQVEIPDEFSLAQIWIVNGSYGEDLTTLEAGWQACYYFH
ncbi:protein neprosin-like [Cicer arietinum]|uniref:Uncharacterized protein LOC101489290 n=1 Tax=Cicer arietinum TaxID=3827 RepID=A0A1S2Z6X4_CICAR|nr:uncharacterized protein LOC101489290 [Cicer arietinum]